MDNRLTHAEHLLVRLWDAVEDNTDVATQNEISDHVGWAELSGTIAGLIEKSDTAPTPTT